MADDVGGGGGSGSGDGIAGAGVGGEVAPEWMDGLPDDLAGDASLRQFDSLDGLAKSYIETKRMVGNSVRIPHDQSGAEDWAAFDAKLTEKVPGLVRIDPDGDLGGLYTRLGRPEEASGYSAPSFDDGVSYDAGRIDAFRPIAHKHGLTDKQFAGIVSDMVAAENGQLGEIRQRSQADMEAFRQQEGARFEETENLAKQFLNTIGREHQYDVPFEALSPREIAMFANVMRKVGGEGAGVGDSSGDEGPKKMTPAMAREEIDAIRRNPEHPYNNKNAPGHAAARARMRQLYVMEQGSNNAVVAQVGGVSAG